MNEINNEFVRRMKQLKRIMQEDKEKHGHDQMALKIDDFITMVDMVDQADEVEGREFFVMVNGENPIVVTVKRDEYRGDHMDVHSVLEQWITNHYGLRNEYRQYDYWEIKDRKRYSI